MPLIKLHLSGHTTSIRRKTKYYGIVNEIPNDFETTLERTLYSIIFFYRFDRLFITWVNAHMQKEIKGTRNNLWKEE